MDVWDVLRVIESRSGMVLIHAVMEVHFHVLILGTARRSGIKLRWAA